jgi:ArsR family transcriptional regulator
MGNLHCERGEEHERNLQKAKGKLLSSVDLEKVCKIFYLLSDPGRFKIVQTLLQGELCVYHLCEICQSTVSAVSHQLRLLKDNGIIKARKFGKNVEYSIADEHVKEIIETGIRHLSCTVDV